jgi:signal transduction histidine kinase
MAVRTILAPLVSTTTFRRAVHLVLGGVILLPYVLLAAGFVQMFAEPDVPRVPVGVLVAVTAAIGVVPPFLPAMRALEISAARSLLGVDLPEPRADPPWSARRRAAAWYVLHLVVGGLAVVAVLYALPVAVGLLVEEITGAGGPLAEASPFDQVDGPWVVAVVVALLVVLGYVIAGLGSLLARLAPALLGPSSADRIAALQAEAERLAERQRLARELHDSLGHALTVTTLQAAAAGRVLDTDPEFARRALRAVEDIGRTAMADLDRVIALLRDDGGAGSGEPRSLAQLDQLIAETRSAGTTLTMKVVGDPATVPEAVSREAYRIVQEGLTNALRHAGPVPVSLRVSITGAGLRVELANPLPAGDQPAAEIGGRGLVGMQERVRALGGRFSAGPADGEWRVQAHLPVHPPAGAGR